MTFTVRRDGLVNTNGHLQEVYTYINYEKPKIKVIKRDSKTNEIIQGAVLELKNIETDEKKNYTVGVEEITLDAGRYELKEKSTVDGYIYSREVVSIRVENNGEMYVNDTLQASGFEYNYYNHPKPKINIKKVDSDTGEKIEGVVLELKNLSTNQKEEFLVGEKEIILDEGEYELKEKRTINGYILSKQVVSLTVNERGELTVDGARQESGYLLNFKNHKKPKATLTKKDTETGEVIEGATFRVKNQITNTYEDVTVGSSSMSFDEGEYEISEIMPSNGYLKDDRKVRIQVNNNGELTVDGVKRNDNYEIIYQNIKNTLRIHKVDESGEIVPGAVIGIYNGNVEIVRFTTTNADTVLRGLKRGIYTVKEISSPENYIKSEDSYQVEVDENGVEPGVVEITNILMPKITIEKIDSDTREKVIGARLAIKNERGIVIAFIKTKEENYSIHLPYGKYTLSEEEAPEGYIKSEEEKEFVLDRNSEKEIKISFSNEPNYRIFIRKIGLDGKGLEGAILELSDQNGNIIKENIKTTKEGIWINHLEKGIYQIKEVKAPDGYLLKEQAIKVELNTSNKMQEVTIVNEHIPVPNTFMSVGRKIMIILSLIILGIGAIMIKKSIKKNNSLEKAL